MDYKELLKDLGDNLGGGAELESDGEGVVALDVDGMVLAIAHIDELDQVALSGAIGELPPEDLIERLYRALLVANFNFGETAGATLAINPDSNQVTICKVLPLSLIDGEKFLAEMDQFVRCMLKWRQRIQDFRGE